MATPKGGYDYEFIAPPPQSLECSICLLTLRDPHVTTCCGNHFCQPCISRIQQDNKPCPLCNEPGFTTFLHKGVAREVKALKVHCPNKPQGCDWQGELGQVDQHLNPGPAESRERGCGFVMVECRYRCGGRFQHRMIEQHEMEDCPRRPVEVQMAFVMKKLEALATENKVFHREVQCIREENRALTAENAALKDKIHETGAELKAENTKLKQVTDAAIAELRAENKALQQQIDARPLPAVPPFYYTLTNYEHYKKNNAFISSTPFYSHQCGYKMKFLIYPNGLQFGKNTHLSLYIAIMRGEYDDKLQWPFKGRVTVEMYNFKMEQWSQRTVIRFRDYPVKKADNHCGITCGNFGYYGFMLNDQLKREFLGEDMVRFRIAEVETEDCPRRPVDRMTD